MRRTKGLTEGYGVVVDVHSGSVGLALIHSLKADSLPEVIFSCREEVRILENADTDALIRAFRQALFAASMQFSQEGMQVLKKDDPGAKLERLLLVCGAPWAETVTRTIHVEDSTPFIVTRGKLDSLIEEAEHRDEEEFKASALLKELDLTLVEHVISHTAVNGYVTEDPYGKKATELSLGHISGLIPSAISKAVHEMEDKLFPHAVRTTHTFALVLFCVLRDLYPHTKNALLIDISGEATELCIMQDEMLLETLVFPFGTHTLVRHVAENLKTFPEEALTHLKEYGEKTPENIRLAIGRATEKYIAELGDAYKTLEKKYIIPKHIFFMAGRKLDSVFENIVKQVSTPYLTGHGTYISLNKTFGEKSGENLTAHDDMFFKIESAFFHKMNACGDMY